MKTFSFEHSKLNFCYATRLSAQEDAWIIILRGNYDNNQFFTSTIWNSIFLGKEPVNLTNFLQRLKFVSYDNKI